MVVISSAVAAGAAVGGLNVLSGILEYQGKKQDYVNQVAYKQASDEFARWSARQQASQADINNQYKFWQERINYGQSLAHTNQLRNYELSTAIANAEEVARARASAGADYTQTSAAYSEAFRQEAMADAVALMQYKVQALKSRSSIAAGMTEGKSIDRLINDYSRQVGDFETLQNINQGFKGRQYSDKQAAAISQYLNQYNNQRFYQQKEYEDPLPPFAPLPTLISAPGPSMVGSAPSFGAALVGSVASGVKAGFGTYGALS
tara:strand:+ start:765 stop:1550 length:786 start_codon:yes stop_codon:yes gene_type:complete